MGRPIAKVAPSTNANPTKIAATVLNVMFTKVLLISNEVIQGQPQ